MIGSFIHRLDSLKRHPILITVSLLVALVALVVYLSATADQDVKQKVSLEAIKVLMQLIALGIIGTLVTWVLNERSKEKELRVQREDALNEFRRSAVTRVVTATNVVRKAPILIETHRSKETYDEQARTLLDASLSLRLIRHDLPNVEKAFPGNTKTIQCEIRKMENYLNSIVDEWQRCYKDLPDPPGDAWYKIERFEKLADLRKEADRQKEDGTSRFNNEYLCAHRKALELMRKDIFGDDAEFRAANERITTMAEELCKAELVRDRLEDLARVMGSYPEGHDMRVRLDALHVDRALEGVDEHIQVLTDAIQHPRGT